MSFAFVAQRLNFLGGVELCFSFDTAQYSHWYNKAEDGGTREHEGATY